MYSKAIVRIPCPTMINGLTSADLGKPDYRKALVQHAAYVRALEQCGLEVTIMEPDDRFPDSTFVEDTALLTPRCAILTYPGAPSRRGEVESIEPVIAKFYANIERIRPQGTLDAGDVMMVGSHFYIGLSGRTSREGAGQLIAILQKYGLTGSAVPIGDMLHLKTGVAYLEHNNLLATGEFAHRQEFRDFNILRIEDDESYAANSLWINGTVIIPERYPKARKTIETAGYEIIEVDVSEFRKIDGGLSCLSLRF